MSKTRLPRNPAEAWPGGFVLVPHYVGYVSAGAGTVVAAGESVHLLRPGAAAFVSRKLTQDTGDALALAVEPRRPARYAIGGIDSLSVFDGKRDARVRFPPGHPEPEDLAWGPVPGGSRRALHVLLDDGVVQCFLPETQGVETLDFPEVQAMASNEAGGLVYACFDEERWELDVYLMVDPKSGRYFRRSVEAPATMSDVRLAVAGEAIAVSLEFGEVWLTRGGEEPFLKVEGLLGGGPVAFQGTRRDAALFGAAREDGVDAIVRVDAEGRADRIAEIDTPADEPPVLRRFAWDETRKTLWTAAGRAGLLCSTAPGARPPLGASAPS